MGERERVRRGETGRARGRTISGSLVFLNNFFFFIVFSPFVQLCPFFRVFGAKKSMLPTISSSSEVYGTITESHPFAGVPICGVSELGPIRRQEMLGIYQSGDTMM